ncbi:nodulation protein NodZ [Amphritea balenae]|uniref:Uncharacterized protein n=1 Tax=Amphritea balenae TaxID=452629 RepID=A0A3P1STK3_9GAMM|nr:nodulation protein NodZ [Amphritea balenae]RRD00539.1 hypothetical protein EHS89_05470 [Amphritea balenae]GGK69889.1 hypothetical protein GCM10007941_20170 [Amphritea balenae]
MKELFNIFKKKNDTKRLYMLNEKDIDLIRDSGLFFERRGSIFQAMKLMSLVKELRPEGRLITRKCKELEDRSKNYGSFTCAEEQFNYRNYFLCSDKPSHERYIVSADVGSIYSGLGAMIQALGPVWKYAKQTGRTLVIDWRNSPYLRNYPDMNLFSRLFEIQTNSISGVKIIADDTVRTTVFPNTLLMSRIEQKHESGALISSYGRGIDNADTIQILMEAYNIRSGIFLPLLFSQLEVANRYSPLSNHNDPFCSYGELKRFYSELKLRPEIQRQVDQYSEKFFKECPVIGLHIRHGNGEEKVRDHFSSRTINDFNSFIDNLVLKIKKIAKQQEYSCYKVFIATDSDQVVNAVKEYIPELLTREIWRQETDQGVDFDGAFGSPEEGINVAANALIDMYLLANSDVAILTRSTCFAYQVPYVQSKPGARFISPDEFATF